MANFLQPLIPVIAWILLLILRPDFSFSEFISNYYTLMDNEKRLLDLVIFSTLTAYMIKLVEIVFLYINQLRPIKIKIYFEDIQDKLNPFTLLDGPEGHPKRVKLLLEAEYYNQFAYNFIEKYLGPLELEVQWPDKWLIVEIDDVDMLNYQLTEGSINIMISEILGWLNKEAEIKLAIATMHTHTRSGVITAKIKPINIFKNIFRIVFIKSERATHLLRLRQ